MDKEDDIIEEKAAGVVLFKFDQDKNPLFLLMQSSAESAHWLPPKGHKEKDETDHQAAFREVEEECGFINDKDYTIYSDFKVSLKYLVNGKPKKTVYFLGKMDESIESTVKLSNEHKDYKWLLHKDVLLLLQHQNSKHLFDEALECIEFKKENGLI